MHLDITRIFFMLLMFGSAWLIFSIPSSYMSGYVEWVHKTHGRMISSSIGFLVLSIGVGILLMLTYPIKYSLIGAICSVVMVFLIFIVAWDNYKFWKTSFNSKRN